MAQATIGHKRVNHGGAGSGAAAASGAAVVSGANAAWWAMRPAQSPSAVAEGQRLPAVADRRNSDDAPPRQRGAAGRWANGRGVIDSISAIGA